ncbi:hypothetical protein C8F04DRAFT_1332710 [Mycena alexandri]|uniref:Uncharacterized protein n=1 Tax=Mycena alexandri TaxID=1745969 RepID=A0AAD6X9J2_9AGAR|nr:hypothetical protein C8F04DRAFT_1332710 [Mycena alexandri]
MPARARGKISASRKPTRPTEVKNEYAPPSPEPPQRTRQQAVPRPQHAPPPRVGGPTLGAAEGVGERDGERFFVGPGGLRVYEKANGELGKRKAENAGGREIGKTYQNWNAHSRTNSTTLTMSDEPDAKLTCEPGEAVDLAPPPPTSLQSARV